MSVSYTHLLPDEEQRRSAWQMLARLYARQGQYQPAMEALGHLPSCNQELSLIHI